MAHRVARLATAGVLQLAALVLAHQLVYVVRYGSRYGEELVHAGHGEAWSFAVTTSVVLALGLIFVAAARLAYLGTLLRREGHGSAMGAPGPLDVTAFVRTWLRLAPRMAVLGTVLLTVQENLERASVGQAMPGPGVLLSQEYPAGLWIAVAVALAVSFLAALFEWHRGLLLARLRRARTAHRRQMSAAARRPVVRVVRPVGSLIGRGSALRAPPIAAAAA
jgi:hypothetical protein